MIERGLGVLVAAAVLASALPATVLGDVRRETTPRRPYIVEIGEPYSISMGALQREASKILELQEYLSAYGYPDYAEIQEIQPQWPWESNEVRLYYLRRDLETDFGHVIFSAAMPNLGVLKFLGPIPPDKAHQIEVILQARQAPALPPAPIAEAVAPAAAPALEASTGGLSEALVARLEAAAERAAQAADRAVSESDAAVHAADRTENIVAKLDQGTPGASRRRR
jgi:hypothetical protein